MAKIKIDLEDNGQDVLWMLCDEHGTVVDAGPYQSAVWTGHTIPVWDSELMRVGEPCPINLGMIRHSFLKHNIEKVQTIKD